MRDEPVSTQEVVLITRVRTLNKGNQALSAAWLGLVKQAFPGTSIRLLERRAQHLAQYTLQQISRARDPFRAFDALTTQLARLAPGPDFVAPVTGEHRVVLDERLAGEIRFERLRQRVNLRGWLARAGRYRHDYRARLAAFQRARLVVINPAGEFFPRSPEPAFYYLIDAHVAHKLGRPTAIVNHTMDIDDATLRALVPRVYRDLALVGFRDSKSIDAFRAMGGDTHNVVVSPDLALLSRAAPAQARRRGTVAIAINVPEAAARGYAAQWIDVVRSLRAANVDVVLVSNEVPADDSFYQQIRRELGVRFEGLGLDFDRYAALLGTFDAVVSSRMHTVILAMVGGTAVVPVEGASFKITGLFQEIGLDIPVTRPSTPGWASEVVERTLATIPGRDAQVAQITSRLSAIRTRIGDSLLPRLRAAEIKAA
jgi:polysaccharide pyruvyl transferase WcaK-like protein